LAELSRDETGARLVTADHGEFAAADWEALAERALGARLPLNDLPKWLAGQAPSAASGWRVEYLDYESAAADALPTLIEFRREDIAVRVKIDHWSRNP
jgi:outer membrane lipoprotein LolB